LLSLPTGQEELLRELRRPTAMPEYTERRHRDRDLYDDDDDDFHSRPRRYKHVSQAKLSEQVLFSCETFKVILPLNESF